MCGARAWACRASLLSHCSTTIIRWGSTVCVFHPVSASRHGEYWTQPSSARTLGTFYLKSATYSSKEPSLTRIDAMT